MIEQTLKEIGLTENEIKIYLALIELGEATSGEIINKASIKTGRIYDILNSLQEKGFISIVLKNKVKRFSPAEPTMILEYLKKRSDDIREQEKQASAFIPMLFEKIQNKKPGTKVEVYTGFEGMKTAYLKEITRYRKKGDILVIGTQSNTFYEKKVTDFFKYTVSPERIRNKMQLRKINDNSARDSVLPEEKNKNTQIRYMNLSSFTTINIVMDLVIIGIFVGEGVFITIEDQVVDDNFKTQFEFLWKIAKK